MFSTLRILRNLSLLTALWGALRSLWRNRGRLKQIWDTYRQLKKSRASNGDDDQRVG